MKLKSLLTALFFVCIICLPDNLLAQFGSNPYGSTSVSTESSSSSATYSRYRTRFRCCYGHYHYGTGPDCPTTKNVPFDGGLSLLVGAGVAYGFKKAYRNRKKNAVSTSTEK